MVVVVERRVYLVKFVVLRPFVCSIGRNFAKISIKKASCWLIFWFAGQFADGSSKGCGLLFAVKKG